MTLTPLQRRAEQRRSRQPEHGRHEPGVADRRVHDPIFFLPLNASGVELLPSRKAVKLPQSVADKEPARDGRHRQRHGSPRRGPARRVGGRGDGDAGRPDLDAEGRALDLQAQRQVLRQENVAQSKALTIMGDKDVFPYQLLRKVMFTAARANFSDVSFASAGDL